MITNDYELGKVAKEYAEELIREANGDFEQAREEAFGYVDSSEHVIYTARAISICANCYTDEGEEWLEEVYENPFEGCTTYSEVNTRLAYAVLYQAVLAAIGEIEEESEDE